MNLNMAQFNGLQMLNLQRGNNFLENQNHQINHNITN